MLNKEAYFSHQYQPYQSYLVMTSIFDKSYLFCLLFLSASYYACAQKAELAKPNVIVILTDDQGSIDLNSYGAKDLYTPNMDRLAKEGVRFTQFYAGAPVCSPSRAALLTGKTNLRAGLPNNVPIPEKAEATGQYGLPTEEITMAEMLKDNGYKGLVISADSANFCAGANLNMILNPAYRQDWDELNRTVKTMQDILQSLRYAPFPVVAAPFGLVLEFSLISSRAWFSRRTAMPFF